MNPHIAIVLCIIGGLFALLTLELVRRKLLHPKHAILWGAMALIAVGVAFVPGVVDWLVTITGMTYQSSVIVLVFLFTAFMLMGQSVITSRHSHRILRLTQEIALLRMELDQLRDSKKTPDR